MAYSITVCELTYQYRGCGFKSRKVQKWIIVLCDLIVFQDKLKMKTQQISTLENQRKIISNLFLKLHATSEIKSLKKKNQYFFDENEKLKSQLSELTKKPKDWISRCLLMIQIQILYIRIKSYLLEISHISTNLFTSIWLI